MINTSANHVLYIEPLLNQKSINPQDDCITEFMQELWDRAKSHKLVQTHRGFHTACDGTNWNGVALININAEGLAQVESGEFNFFDLLQRQNTLETHEACVHYLRWFRQAIPSSEWQKILELANQFRINNEAYNEALSTAIQIELEIAQERESQFITDVREHAEQVAAEIAQSGEDFMSDLLSDIPLV